MSSRSKHTTVVLLAGGQGKRMGSKVAKQYLEIGGKPVLWYSLNVINKSDFIDDCVLVIRPEDEEYVKDSLLSDGNFPKVTKIAYAGKERYESVWNGISAICDNEGNADTDVIFVHDGARPFITEKIIKDNYDAVCLHGACVTAVKGKDTVKIVNSEGVIEATPNRDSIWNMQTPQTFDAKLLYQAYKEAVLSGETQFTDDAMTVEKYADTKVHVVEGDYRNIKITTPEDMLIAEAYLREC